MGLHTGDLICIKDELLETGAVDPILEDWANVEGHEVVQEFQGRERYIVLIRHFLRDTKGRLAYAYAYVHEEGFHSVKYVSEVGLEVIR